MEYGLLIALLAVISLAAIKFLGLEISGTINEAGQGMEGSQNGGGS